MEGERDTVLGSTSGVASQQPPTRSLKNLTSVVGGLLVLAALEDRSIDLLSTEPVPVQVTPVQMQWEPKIAVQGFHCRHKSSGDNVIDSDKKKSTTQINHGFTCYLLYEKLSQNMRDIYTRVYK